MPRQAKLDRAVGDASDSPVDRNALRQALRERRTAFARSPAFQGASLDLAQRLLGVLAHLEPQTLGLYWPLPGEFNAAQALSEDMGLGPSLTEEALAWPLALPFAKRAPAEMHYRAWARQAPKLRDECGIPSSEGAPLVPDVILVPCLGYTPSGHRLGYGGGYFDRYLAAHPEVTAIGVAWSLGALSDEQLQPQAHDQPLLLVVTEAGVVSSAG